MPPTEYQNLALLLTDREAAHMHYVLAAYHAERAKSAVLDIIHEYHEQLAESLAAEAKRIPERERARSNARA